MDRPSSPMRVLLSGPVRRSQRQSYSLAVTEEGAELLLAGAETVNPRTVQSLGDAAASDLTL
jgi:hypothetical protein